MTLSSLNLNLSGNSIGENGAKLLAQGISNLVGLTSLDLDLYKSIIGENGA